MCVVVELAERPGGFWCRGDAAIHVPAGLSPDEMLSLTRTVLQQLGAVQPAESTMEARCYCGVPLTVRDMPGVLAVVPPQRIHRAAEAHHGT